MTLSRSKTPISLALAGAFALLAPQAHAASNDIIVESAASGGTAETAKPYLDQFSAYAQKVLTGWKPITASFFSDAKSAQVGIAQAHPGFGLMDIDLFLEIREKEELVVLAQVEGAIHNRGHLHVIVKDPAIKTIDDLKGKTIISNQIQSPKFLSKAVFGGKYDAEKFFVLKPTPSPLKGLKAVDRGEAAATIVDDAQLAGMKMLPFAASLRTLYSSPAIPSSPFVAFGKVAKPEERIAMQKMLYGMCSDPKGAEVCKSLQVKKFEKPDIAAYNDTIKRYGK
ncbi:MAG: PhnD/SsuA/transferrin family substrate-binding protein [Polyangia bacterium]